MHHYAVTTPPASQPITLAEVKDQVSMRAGNTLNDDLLNGLILAAVPVLERYCNRVFINTTFRGTARNLVQDPTRDRYPYVQLYRSPVNTVTSFQRQNNSTFSDVEYDREQLDSYDRLIVPDSDFWDHDRVPDAYRVDFVAGYGATADDVPAPLRRACLAYVAYLFENRGDVVPDGQVPLPLEVSALCAPYRLIGGYF